MRRNSRGRNNKKKTKNTINYKKTNKILISTISILFIALTLVAIFYYFKNRNDYQNLVSSYKQEIENEEKANEENKINNNSEETPTDTTFTLTAIGDIMCHNTQYIDAYNDETGEYDFSYVLMI